MGYKSILTIVTDPQLPAAQMDAAIALARREDAHLDVLCLGIDRTQTGYYYAGATAVIHQETFELARNEAAETEAAVRARLGAEEIRWAVETVVTQLATLTEPVAVQARFPTLSSFPNPMAEKTIMTSRRFWKRRYSMDAARFSSCRRPLSTRRRRPVWSSPGTRATNL